MLLDKKIIAGGFHHVSPKARSKINAAAGDTFTSRVALTQDDLPPPPNGYQYDLSTCIALKMKTPVDAHRDDYSGGLITNHDAQTLSCFVLVHHTYHHPHLMVEDEVFSFQGDNYVFFDDSKLHVLIINKTWIGVACQLIATN